MFRILSKTYKGRLFSQKKIELMKTVAMRATFLYVFFLFHLISFYALLISMHHFFCNLKFKFNPNLSVSASVWWRTGVARRGGKLKFCVVGFVHFVLTLCLNVFVLCSF